ncbi:MAG: hypothetical protein V3V14_12030 [Saprospiraceae bacterium]
MNFTKTTLLKIEKIFEEQDYTIRYEKGNFQSGYCIVEHNKVVVVNKFFDTEGRINVLLDILSLIIVMEDRLSSKSKIFFRQILKSQVETSV